MCLSLKISRKATLIDFDKSTKHYHTCLKHFYIKMCAFSALGPCIEHKIQNLGSLFRFLTVVAVVFNFIFVVVAAINAVVVVVFVFVVVVVIAVAVIVVAVNAVDGVVVMLL